MNSPTISEEKTNRLALVEGGFSILLDDKLNGSTGGTADGCAYDCVALSFGSDGGGRTVSRPIPSSSCKQLLSKICFVCP